MKTCCGCKEVKPLESFAKNKNTSDGLQTLCKPCQKAYREQLKVKVKPKFERLMCARCSVTKSVEDFPKVGSSSTGYGSWCSECKKKYNKDYDPEVFKKWRRDRMQWFRAIKAGQSCVDCGQMFEPSCMDYDHIGEDKVENVARMVAHNYSKERILEEIKKCELVCVLCHNRRTQKRLEAKGANKYKSYVLNNINIINQAKSIPCEYCGQQYEVFNMQFDHKDANTKLANICQLKSSNLFRLMEEIKKCRVLCALCHRRKTFIEVKGGVYPKGRPKISLAKTTFIDLEAKKKECSRCHEVLDFDKFRSNKKTKIGIDSWCRVCSNESKRIKRKENKENPIQIESDIEGDIE